jgi:hypothetical protein
MHEAFFPAFAKGGGSLTEWPSFGKREVLIPNFQGGIKVPSVSTVGNGITWKYQQNETLRALGREISNLF